MDILLAETSALGVAATSTATTATEVAAGAAAQAVGTEALMPGTLSPAVVLSTARVMEHGANRLAMSEMGAAMVAAAAATYGATAVTYETVDVGNAAALAV
ncbi:MAG: hypothetical protein AB7G47_20120 [Mycolicibacterium sp.]|uniref:hypothetical protein n=1 Tax=Mycolicibacterium sp. TaxID=2320850 RepID=UPI003D0F1DE9